MKTVSVIVPVYNGEQYLERCMECLTQQTLQDIEIILVDDASTDSTGKLLDQWQQRLPERIQVVHLDVNRGPGGARNVGLQKASGEYVGFMDCDDRIDVTMYQKLYEKAKQGALDVVDCGYYSESEQAAILSFTDDVVGILDGEQKSKLITGVGYSVTKIFRRDLLLQHNCYFREGVIYEDLDYLIHIIRVSKRVGNVKEVLYHYVDNSNSATKEENEQKKFEQMLSLMRVLFQMPEEEELRLAMEYAELNCCVCGIGMCLMNQDNKAFHLIENLKRLKAETAGRWRNWEENPYVSCKMPSEHQEFIRWFFGLNL